MLLLTEGTGPLDGGSSQEELARASRAAVHATDPADGALHSILMAGAGTPTHSSRAGIDAVPVDLISILIAVIAFAVFYLMVEGLDRV